jgi:hypothetical protein
MNSRPYGTALNLPMTKPLTFPNLPPIGSFKNPQLAKLDDVHAALIEMTEILASSAEQIGMMATVTTASMETLVAQTEMQRLGIDSQDRAGERITSLTKALVFLTLALVLEPVAMAAWSSIQQWWWYG